MNLDEYQQLAKRTAKHPDPNADMYELMALGLIGETGEVVDLIKKHEYHGVPMDVEKLKKEAGDVIWYLANGLTLFGIAMPTDVKPTTAPLPVKMGLYAANIANVIYGESAPTDANITGFLSRLAGLVKEYGFTLEDAADVNIEKLQRRYPDGFNLDKARNHDSE